MIRPAFIAIASGVYVGMTSISEQSPCKATMGAACSDEKAPTKGMSLLQLGQKRARSKWPRFSSDDCVKQTRADASQCIPCKKILADGSVTNRFSGNCKRDATVIASQIFTPWHSCSDGGGCKQGKLPRFRGQVCWAFNKGEFTRWSDKAGVCIKESESRHMPSVSYALANMAHSIPSWQNTADFIAAYQWSMEQRLSWGDLSIVMTCQKFCKGEKACGEVGDCTCGDKCPPTPAPRPTPMPLPTPIPPPMPVHDASKCLENGKHDNDCCAKPTEASCADGHDMEVTDSCWGNEYFNIRCSLPNPPTPKPPPTVWTMVAEGKHCLSGSAWLGPGGTLEECEMECKTQLYMIFRGENGNCKCDVTCDDKESVDDIAKMVIYTSQSLPPNEDEETNSCLFFCATNAKTWKAKCGWKNCNGCPECDATPVPPAGPCKSYCAANAKTWKAKCGWKNCDGCPECDATPAQPAGLCNSHCAANAKTWKAKCGWKNCNGCAECDATPAQPAGLCNSHCAPNAKTWKAKCGWKNCNGCAECDATSIVPQ